MVKLFKNGDAVIDECIFCGGTFEEPQTLGRKISCPSEDEGGCDRKYKISIYGDTAIKSDSEND